MLLCFWSMEEMLRGDSLFDQASCGLYLASAAQDKPAACTTLASAYHRPIACCRWTDRICSGLLAKSTPRVPSLQVRSRQVSPLNRPLSSRFDPSRSDENITRRAGSVRFTLRTLALPNGAVPDPSRGITKNMWRPRETVRGRASKKRRYSSGFGRSAEVLVYSLPTLIARCC